MASPMNLSMTPRLARIGSDITVKYRFITLTRPPGVMPSLIAVNPLMSQNMMVITRRWPSTATSGRSISPCTTLGSM